MAFQSAVVAQIGLGVVGELAYEGPLRAQPAILRSTSAANNVVGRAARIVAGATGSFNVAADPKAVVVSMDAAAGVFAGILANPKVYANGGTVAGGTLAENLTLPNETVAEFVTEGDVIVALPAASAPGDVVYGLVANGSLVATAPGAAQPANSFGPIGTVERFTNTAAGLAVLHLEPIVPQPPAA